MKLKNLPTLAAAIFCILCAGCGEPKVDVSSDQAFAKSLGKIYRSVPEAEQEAFRDFLYLAMEGKVSYLSPLDGVKRKVPSYDEIVKTYSLVKAAGQAKGLEQLRNISGLTRAGIINHGQAILKADLEARQDSLNEEIAKQEKIIAECVALAEDHAKVSIELSGQVEVVEAKRPGDAGKAGAFAIASVIVNGSSRHLRNIKFGGLTISDEKGNTAGGTVSFYDFETETGEKLFQDGNKSLGLKPGETAKGKLVARITPSSLFPYPPDKALKYEIRGDEKAMPVLDDENGFDKFREAEARDRLARSQEEMEAVRLELARLGDSAEK